MIEITLFTKHFYIRINTEHERYSECEMEYVRKCSKMSGVELNELGKLDNGIQVFSASAEGPDIAKKLYDFLYFLAIRMDVTIS